MSMMQEATPSQLEAHRLHKERLLRLGAVKIVDRGIVKRDTSTFPPAKPVLVPLAPEVADRVMAEWRAAKDCAAWLAAERALLQRGHSIQRQITAPGHVILAMVGKHLNVSRIDLCSQRRTHNIVRPRQIAMYLIKMLTGASLPSIGRLLGGRDHTTCLSGIRKINSLLSDPYISESIKAIAVKLASAGFDISPLNLNEEAAHG